MKPTLSEIIEQFEDAFILQPMNELEIYRKWIPKLRQAYDEVMGTGRKEFDQEKLDTKQVSNCTCADIQGGPCSACMELKYNL